MGGKSFLYTWFSSFPLGNLIAVVYVCMSACLSISRCITMCLYACMPVSVPFSPPVYPHDPVRSLDSTARWGEGRPWSEMNYEIDGT